MEVGLPELAVKPSIPINRILTAAENFRLITGVIHNNASKRKGRRWWVVNEKELLNRKVIVYSLLSALVVLAGSRDRKIKLAPEGKEAAANECSQSK